MLSEEADCIPEVLKLAYKPHELPHFTSNKYFIPDQGTRSHEVHAQQTYYKLLQEQMTNREKNIYKGVVNLDDKSVICLKRKGKLNLGSGTKDGFRFYPEEALLQVEYGLLEVVMDKDSLAPLSLQNLYDIMIPWVTMEFYQTYSYLVRLGYIVRRHDSRTLAVYKPRTQVSGDPDFHVAVLEQHHKFPNITEILKMVQRIGQTSVKISRTCDGKVYFYNLALVDFPEASDLV